MTAGPGHLHQAGHSPASGALLLACSDASGIGPERGTRAAVRRDTGNRVFSGDAIAARLTAEGITCRMPRDGTLTLAAEVPGSAPDPLTVVIETGTVPASGATAPASAAGGTPAGA